MTTIHIDFETRSTVDLKKAGLDVYARHPQTDVHCMGYAFGEAGVAVWHPPLSQVSCQNVLDAVTRGATVVCHNAAFELGIWNEIMVPRYGWPGLKPEQVQCTMAMAYAMALPGALVNAAPALGLEERKDAAGARVMMQLAKPRDVKPDGTPVWRTPEDSPEKFAQLYAYCKQDVEVERQLYKRLMKLSEQERRLWQIDQRINQRGVAVDLKAVKTAIEVVTAEKLRLDREMRRVTGNAVATCSAVGQLTQWLKWSGVDVAGVAKADVLEWLESPNLPAVCREALMLRQEAAKSSTAKLEAMLKGVCDDGRMRGLFQYHGASTGRWAGRRVQLQNLPRSKLKQREIDEVFGILGGVA